MARNTTVVQEFDAEFRGIAFASGASKKWVPARFQGSSTEPYAVSTIANDLLDSGRWIETDVKSAFPNGLGSYETPIDRVFVRETRPGGGFGAMLALCGERK